MPSAKHVARRRTPIARSSVKTSKSKTKAKAKNEATATRDALPFFQKGRGKIPTSWWNVTPSGNYSADIETGMAYASAFLPLMKYNAGAASLGAIVSDMAKAGRNLEKGRGDRRGIDNIALGFIMGIGGILQSTMGGIAIAATAIEMPEGNLSAEFVKLVKSGHAFDPLRRSTLFHDPDALFLERDHDR
jgi:hypothetical protein